MKAPVLCPECQALPGAGCWNGCRLQTHPRITVPAPIGRGPLPAGERSQTNAAKHKREWRAAKKAAGCPAACRNPNHSPYHRGAHA